MTQYNFEVPDDVWTGWKETVPRSYTKLADRIEVLIDADRRCQEEHGEGVVERLDRLEGAE